MDQSTYAHFQTSPAKPRTRRMVRYAFYLLSGAAAATVLFLLLRENISFFGGEKQQELGAPLMATRSQMMVSRPGLAKVPYSSMRKSAPILRPEGWRRVRINPGPGIWGSPLDMGFGRFADELVDIFDEMSRMNEATTYKDMEDYLVERRKLRQDYEKQMDDLREKQVARQQEREIERTSKFNEKRYSDFGPAPSKREIQISGEVAPARGWMVPQLSFTETDDGNYKYTLDTQGMNKDNIKLMLQDNILIVEGQQMTETDNGYHSASFKRSFTLPKDADLESLISEELPDGQLQFTAARLEPKSETGREIKIQRISSKQQDERTGDSSNSPGMPASETDGKVDDVNDTPRDKPQTDAEA